MWKEEVNSVQLLRSEDHLSEQPILTNTSSVLGRLGQTQIHTSPASVLNTHIVDPSIPSVLPHASGLHLREERRMVPSHVCAWVSPTLNTTRESSGPLTLTFALSETTVILGGLYLTK